MYIGLTTLVCVGFSLLLKKKSDRVFRVIVISVSGFMLLIEGFKQLIYGPKYFEEKKGYSWFEFPFQFCSTPMYIGLLAGLWCKGRLQKCLYCYLGTFGLFGGLCVYLYADQVLTHSVFKSNFSMIFHGGIILLGIIVLIYRVEAKHSYFFYGVPVFLVLVVIADILNIWYHFALSKTEGFNMFYINPYRVTPIPLLEGLRVKGLALYPVFLLIYLVVFCFAAYLMLLGLIIIKWLIKKIKKTWEGRHILKIDEGIDVPLIVVDSVVDEPKQDKRDHSRSDSYSSGFG
jgi:hypothetical protein